MDFETKVISGCLAVIIVLVSFVLYYGSNKDAVVFGAGVAIGSIVTSTRK